MRSSVIRVPLAPSFIAASYEVIDDGSDPDCELNDESGENNSTDAVAPSTKIRKNHAAANLRFGLRCNVEITSASVGPSSMHRVELRRSDVK